MAAARTSNVVAFPGAPRAATADTGVHDDSWDELRRRLDTAVRRVCPRHLADRRDDLVQVAVLRVMDVVRKSEGDRELASSYLYRVAYSALVDEIRRLRRRQEVAMDDDEGRPMPIESARPDPERRAAGRQAGRAITACLERLVEARRLAVTLYLQGHGTPDASGILGWSVKRTENLIYRGLADLRRCLDTKGWAP